MQPYLLFGDPPKEGEEINWIFHHALDHTLFHIPGTPLAFTNFTVMLLLGFLVLVVIALTMDKKSAVPRGPFRNFFEGVMLFIRDELARPAMGREVADGFVPFFSTTFLFILTLNLLGLVPIPFVGGTATSSFMVTGTLAAFVLVVGTFSAIRHNGLGGFLKAFVPSGVPGWLVPLLFLLELSGFLIKHGVLMVRLFANMIAGHLVVGAFIGLIFVTRSYLTAVPSVGLALFVNGLELLVSLIQAYVFTLLSVLFVGGVVHPEH